ncbi:exostosin-3 isoform X2 [Daktulosphaira vitifoliae]|uniref:exostosin-3 isoform X2 n=1 Tax=Daktulosphaira vitifoliae TaxID=58002 RepID=UPI0021A9EC00|nr:exostosin-3 isoform X2 [Daktulosphaira vitifoliae]
MFINFSIVKLKLRLVLIVLVLLVVIPLIGHYYLSNEDKNGFDYSYNTRHAKLDVYEDYGTLKASDLKHRILELNRIKNSVNNELRNIEGQRQKLLSELSVIQKKIEDAKVEYLHEKSELEKLKISVKQAQVAENEAVMQNTPRLAPPIPILSQSSPINIPLSTNPYWCQNMKNCFDYSRCSLTSGFPFYFYNNDENSKITSVSFNKIVLQVLRYNAHFTNSSNNACVYVALIGEIDSEITNNQLKNLSFWGGDGRNHILIYLTKKIFEPPKYDENINFGRSIIAQSFWNKTNFRLGHDILLPACIGPPGGEVWIDSPYMLPARRKYLLSFEGYKNVNFLNNNQQNFVEMMNEFISKTSVDQFYLKTNCDNQRIESNIIDWCLCGTEISRKSFLMLSTFTLIPAPLDKDMISTAMSQTRLYESLKFGAIPVFLEYDKIGLPFDEVLDWCKAAICLAGERIPELHWLLRTVSDNDILSMRKQGRMLYEKYLSTVQAVLDTTLSIVRNRIGIPPLPVIDIPSPSIFNENFKPIKMEPIIPDAEPEESLGPLEPSYASPVFLRNFTIMKLQGYELWNGWGDPFKLYPYTPFDILLPSDAKFIGSGKGFRPINNGAGGAGKEFCQSLGGNSPREQFTIVILTYERDQVLMNSLSRLNGLPYLNKVIVVWNSPKPPLEDLRWPEIGVPIHVIHAAKNSLNNRFLPYEAIETEAVLSVDDDAHLRHDEIMFGFS